MQSACFLLRKFSSPRPGILHMPLSIFKSNVALHHFQPIPKTFSRNLSEFSLKSTSHLPSQQPPSENLNETLQTPSSSFPSNPIIAKLDRAIRILNAKAADRLVTEILKGELDPASLPFLFRYYRWRDGESVFKIEDLVNRIESKEELYNDPSVFSHLVRYKGRTDAEGLQNLYNKLTTEKEKWRGGNDPIWKERAIRAGNALLTLFAKRKEVDKAKQTLDFMLTEGLFDRMTAGVCLRNPELELINDDNIEKMFGSDYSANMFTKMFHYYQSSGDVERAEKVWKRIPEKKSIHLNLLVDVLDSSLTLTLEEKLQKIELYVQEAMSIDKSIIFYPVYNRLIFWKIKLGDFSHFKELLTEMCNNSQVNDSTWGFVVQKLKEKVWEEYSHLSSKPDDLKSLRETISWVLLQIKEVMDNFKWQYTAIMARWWLLICFKLEMPEAARTLWEGVSKENQNQYCFNILLATYCNSRQMQHLVWPCFESMRAKGYLPNVHSLPGLIRTAARNPKAPPLLLRLMEAIQQSPLSIPAFVYLILIQSWEQVQWTERIEDVFNLFEAKMRHGQVLFKGPVDNSVLDRFAAFFQSRRNHEKLAVVDRLKDQVSKMKPNMGGRKGEEDDMMEEKEKGK